MDAPPILLAAVLPTGVSAFEAVGPIGEPPVFPEEAPLIARAVKKRRAEFATGRMLARQALASFGIPPVVILAGPGRAPQWSTGFAGSITHCSGYCGASATRTTSFASVGIDAETNAPLPERVSRLVEGRTEALWARDREGDGVCWDRLLFSAKESVFKAWWPLTHRWLGFEDVMIRFFPETTSFTSVS